MKKSEVKTIYGSYNNGNNEFIGTYLDKSKDDKQKQWRVGIWKFWYPNGIMKCEGIYKEGALVSKKCWDSDGQSIDCSLLEINEIDSKIMFKEIT